MPKKNKKKSPAAKSEENVKNGQTYTNETETQTVFPGKKKKNRLFDFE